LFRARLISFYGILEPSVERDAVSYFSIICAGIPFAFVANAVTGALTGSGNSAVPFRINAAALTANVILDPLLIFGLGMGIEGAAVATAVAQALGCALLLAALARSSHPAFAGFSLAGGPPSKRRLARIGRWAAPLAVHDFLFCFMSMLATRFVSAFGAGANAVFRLGTQFESVSWLLAGGFGAAMTSFVGQNFGAGKRGRILRGFRLASMLMAGWGVAATLFLWFCGRALFAAFLPTEPEVVEMGAEYLRILAFAQICMCFEGISEGTFIGAGVSLPPAVVGVAANTSRTVVAWAVSVAGSAGLSGIWWCLTGGAIARGGLMYVACLAWLALRFRRAPAPG